MDPPAKLDATTETALRSMHDIVLPAPVSWMPQTWGWAALGILVLAAAGAWAFAALRRYRRNAYRRQALRLLDDVAVAIGRPEVRAQGIRDLAELLKRTALAAWPRERVAAATGRAWNDLIGRSAPDGEGLALTRLFDDLEYRGDAALADAPRDVEDDLVAEARRWIETHHVSA